MVSSNLTVPAAAWPPPSVDGWWLAQSADLGGVRLPPAALDGLSMLLCHRTLYLGSDVAAIDLDFDRSPAEIDLLVIRGPNKWRFIPGVFTLRDNVLRICLDLSSTARPVTLRPPPGSRHLFVTYERAPCEGTRAA